MNLVLGAYALDLATKAGGITMQLAFSLGRLLYLFLIYLLTNVKYTHIF
jgi:hypothetical protein